MPTLVKRSARRKAKKDNINNSNLSELAKSLLSKSRIIFNKKSLIVKKLPNSKEYEANIKIGDNIKGITLKKLEYMFKKHNMLITDGSLKMGFGKSSTHTPYKSSISFKFKLLKPNRKSKPLRRKPLKSSGSRKQKVTPSSKGNIQMTSTQLLQRRANADPLGSIIVTRQSRKPVSILASFLDNEMRGFEVISQLDKMLAADDTKDSTSNLQVLRHGDAARLAMQLYTEYVSDRDFTYFVNFFKKLDDLIFTFRGNQPLNLDDLDNEDDETPRKKRKKFHGKPVLLNKSKSPTSDTDSTTKDTAADNSVVISADSNKSKYLLNENKDFKNIDEYNNLHPNKKIIYHYEKATTHGEKSHRHFINSLEGNKKEEEQKLSKHHRVVAKKHLDRIEEIKKNPKQKFFSVINWHND
jgi:hypothetical protein